MCVLYTACDTIHAAVVLRSSKAVIEHRLYWARASGLQEAEYVAAVLNSETSRQRVATLQARSQFGARHFDKVMFTLPIPRFDEKQKLHRQLAEVAGRGGAARSQGHDSGHGKVPAR